MTNEGRIDRMLGNAPWWVISAGIHVVLILVATLVCVERLMAVEPTNGLTFFHHTAPPTVSPVEALPDPHQPPGVDHGDPSIVSTDSRVYENPFAEWGDHDESDNDQDTHEVLGKSLDFKGYLDGNSAGLRGTLQGESKGVNDTIGVGHTNGSTGPFGGRNGGNRWLKRRPGKGTDQPRDRADDAVLAALKWLARHQEPDGSWMCQGKCTGEGNAEYQTGVTGLSLLAFLGAGFTHLSKEEFVDAVSGKTLKFGEVVKKGVQWLANHQDPEGCIGPRSNRYMYNHAIATLALCEAFGMSSATVVENPAQKAVDFLVAAQNPGRGWRYTARCGDNDTSVIGWAVMALKSAELSGLRFPRSCFEGAVAWLNEVTEQGGYYRAGYNSRNTGKVFVPGKNEKFANHESMTAVSVLSRIFINQKKDQELGGVQLLVQDLPEWSETKTDAYYWYYGSLALFQYDGPTGPMWSKWNAAMVNTLVPHQDRGGCEDGSWNPAVDRWGFEAGRVFTTAINALTLEVYYRYKNVFGGK